MRLDRKTRLSRIEGEKSIARLKEEFIALLEAGHAEQVYQDFIEHNTQLVPREFIQNHGIHFDLVLRKLAFGADYHSDFCYLSKSSDDWNCILVELEKPSSTFFKRGSNDFHPGFVKALHQVGQWRAWFLNASNREAFTNGTLGLVRVPLGDNPTFMKYVLVLGRRSEYVGNAIRRRFIAAQEADDFKIMTFDSLLEGLKSKHELYVGARRNEFIEILSDRYVDEGIFAWMEPETLQISIKLKEALLAARSSWCHVKSFGTPKIFAVDEALRRIRIVG